MKKIFLCFLLVFNLYASQKQKSLDNVLDGVMGSLDKKFDNIFSDSLSLAETCYDIDFDMDINFDLCALASKLDNLKIDACSLIGGEGGKEIGLSGVGAFCRAQQKKFENYASKQASDFIEYSALNVNDDTKEFLGKFPSGQDVKSYLKVWDVNSLMNDKNSVVSKYLQQGDMDVVNLFMDYSKSSGAKTNPSELTIEDLKAPQSLEDYKNGVNESVRNYKNILKNTNPNSISSLVRGKIQNGGDSSLAQDIVKQNKNQFDVAKNIEIGQVLSNSPYKKIAIPTQEYVQTIRKDLQPKVIAQIRKQQAYEIAQIAKIEEKWAKKYELAKLLADKEVILSQKFDEEAAKSEIDEIVSSANDD